MVTFLHTSLSKMRLIISTLFIVVPSLSFGQSSLEKARTEFVIGDSKGAEFQLEVRQMPLANVLKSISEKTQVPIHYSVLPEGLVTATCVGTSLKPLLECLLDRKADLIVRYPRNLDKADIKGHVAEAWILGSRLDGTKAKADCPVSTGQGGSLTFLQSEQGTEPLPGQITSLLKITKSKNPAERADAIGSLLAIGHQNDPTIKATLEEALHDSDANVRAQAVSTLSHREGSAAAGVIQDALKDDSVDVRLMAVDGITDDIGLLQQAVNDSDEVVRTLAAQKLEQVLQQNKTKP
jgi:hypothetical protein